tara:strand:+ start:104 stop:388 length:285 start_codon:yes stop_codon:yes gene_type:complete
VVAVDLEVVEQEVIEHQVLDPLLYKLQVLIYHQELIQLLLEQEEQELLNQMNVDPQVVTHLFMELHHLEVELVEQYQLNQVVMEDLEVLVVEQD